MINNVGKDLDGCICLHWWSSCN